MYLGRQRPSETTSSVLRSTYTGNGSTTTYALPGPVANETSIIATINGVTQQDAAYTTDGSNIIFSAAPALGDSIELRTLSAVAMSYAPSAGSVVTGVIADGAVTAQKLASGVAVANIGSRAITAGQVPAGSAVQVVSSTKTDTFSFSVTARTWTSVTGLSASITPSSTANKVLVTAVVSVGATNTYNAMGARITRNGTAVAIGDTAGASRQFAFFGSDDWLSAAAANMGQIYISFLDSPSTTSAVTYQLQLINDRDTETIYVNRSQNDGDSSQTFRNVSTITVMEIAG